LKKDLYQGIASAMPPRATILNGFSRWALPMAAQRLKPERSTGSLGGTPEGMPDTSVASNCTTTHLWTSARRETYFAKIECFSDAGWRIASPYPSSLEMTSRLDQGVLL
jgi:hypothetical protein